jgi:hypothetical protein
MHTDIYWFILQNLQCLAYRKTYPNNGLYVGAQKDPVRTFWRRLIYTFFDERKRFVNCITIGNILRGPKQYNISRTD